MTLTLPHQSGRFQLPDKALSGWFTALLLLLLLVLPSWGWGQAVELLTYRDNPVTYEFNSTPNGPFVANANPPELGAVAFERVGTTRDYVMTYTPDPGLTGVDNFRLVHWIWNGGPRVNYVDITVTIRENLLIAKPDYASTTAGQLVAVDALANDISSNGIKMLEAVPAENYGEATFDFETGLLEFRPALDFAGEAHFNYVVCNGEGNCDESTVSITVEPVDISNEEKQVFVKRNESAYILIPDDYELVQGPSMGTYTPATNENVPRYSASDLAGRDSMIFERAGQQLVYYIDILDLTTNSFAFDDRGFTTTGTEVDIDLKANDTSIGTNCMSLSSQPENGSAELLSGGLVNYTPNPGFVGVDQFTYRSFVNACMGEPEIATVYVFVSNFEPTETVFEMATPKRTPIIIGYNVPVGTYDFTISDQGELGEAMFLAGEVDTVIYGARIQGNDILLYVPAPQTNEGLDDFEVTYCLADPSGNGQCILSKTVKIWMSILNVNAGAGPPCVNDCVWAGDANSDGIVNMADLLPIGWQMGEMGNPRAGAEATEWYGQYADDWTDLFGGNETTVNIKHVDTDGDSMVSAADTSAIRTYYGRTHNMTPNVAQDAPYEIYLEAPLFVAPGDLVEVKVILGTADQPAEDVHGIVFPLSYNPDALQPESFDIDWTRDNFLAYDSPILHMDYNDLAGSYEAGYTRTSGRVASGYGVVGTMDVIVDDLVGFRPDQEELILPLGGGRGSALNGAGETVAVKVNPTQLHIKLTDDSPATSGLKPEDLKVGPVPTFDVLRVHLNGQQDIEHLSLRSLTGQVVLQKTVGSNQDNLDLRHLNPGVYILTVSNERGVLNRKIEVMGW